MQPSITFQIVGFNMVITKKGTTIVEAAIYLPLVIITVSAVLSLAITFYDEVEGQVEGHIMKREESIIDGEISKGELEFIHNLDLLVEAL